MSTMIEKVARAICAVQFPTTDPDTLVEWISPMNGPKGSRVVLPMHQHKAWQLFIVDAHAAIQAMCEPTQAMINAGDSVGHHQPVGAKENREALLRKMWPAMVEAALR